MNKKEFIDQLSDKAEISKSQAERSYQAMLDIMMEEISKGQLKISDFGTFEVIKRKPHKGTNPKTGEQIEIPETKTVNFKASEKLKGSI